MENENIYWTAVKTIVLALVCATYLLNIVLFNLSYLKRVANVICMFRPQFRPQFLKKKSVFCAFFHNGAFFPGKVFFSAFFHQNQNFFVSLHSAY